MQKILDGLHSWRVARNMNDKEFVLDVELGNQLEELKEYLDAETDYERIDSLCDVQVFGINSLYYLGINKIDFDPLYHSYGFYGLNEVIASIHRNPIEKISIVIRVSRYLIESLGYDYEKCMLETIKEISSRMQDPEQMKDWATNGVNGKWLKDPNQLESTKYKADYDSCKL